MSEAQTACRATPGFHDDLIGLIGSNQGHVSEGASWILKAELEGDVTLTTSQTAQLMDQLTDVKAWQTQLHLCQLARWLTLSTPQAIAFSSWASAFSDHPRPFLRAWSMDARWQIAQAHPALMPEVSAVIEAALSDPAASVRARARNLGG